MRIAFYITAPEDVGGGGSGLPNLYLTTYPPNHPTTFLSQSKGAVRVAFDITAPEDVGGGGSGVLATFITETSPELFYLTPEERKQLVLQSFVR